MTETSNHQEVVPDTGRQLGLYRYSKSFGRMGDLEGLFVAYKEDVEGASGCVYFGEVLGKHSEVYHDWDPGAVSLITDDPGDLKALKRVGLWNDPDPDAWGDRGSVSGWNPLGCIQGQEDG